MYMCVMCIVYIHCVCICSCMNEWKYDWINAFCLQCAYVLSQKEVRTCMQRNFGFVGSTMLMVHNHTTIEICSVDKRYELYICNCNICWIRLIGHLKAFIGMHASVIASGAWKSSFIKISFQWRALVYTTDAKMYKKNSNIARLSRDHYKILLL